MPLNPRLNSLSRSVMCAGCSGVAYVFEISWAFFSAETNVYRSRRFFRLPHAHSAAMCPHFRPSLLNTSSTHDILFMARGRDAAAGCAKVWSRTPPMASIKAKNRLGVNRKHEALAKGRPLSTVSCKWTPTLCTCKMTPGVATGRPVALQKDAPPLPPGMRVPGWARATKLHRDPLFLTVAGHWQRSARAGAHLV